MSRWRSGETTPKELLLHKKPIGKRVCAGEDAHGGRWHQSLTMKMLEGSRGLPGGKGKIRGDRLFPAHVRSFSVEEFFSVLRFQTRWVDGGR